MSRESTLILIGVVLFVLAFFSGLPFSFSRWIIAALGVIVAAMGYAERRRAVRALASESSATPAAV